MPIDFDALLMDYPASGWLVVMFAVAVGAIIGIYRYGKRHERRTNATR